MARAFLAKPQTALFTPQQGKGCSTQAPRLLCLAPQQGLTCSIYITSQTPVVKLQVLQARQLVAQHSRSCHAGCPSAGAGFFHHQPDLCLEACHSQVHMSRETYVLRWRKT